MSIVRPALSPVTSDLLHAPDQLRHLTLNTLSWLQSDSVAAMIGVASAVVIYVVFWGIRAGVNRAIGPARDIAT